MPKRTAASLRHRDTPPLCIHCRERRGEKSGRWERDGGGALRQTMGAAVLYSSIILAISRGPCLLPASSSGRRTAGRQSRRGKVSLSSHLHVLALIRRPIHQPRRLHTHPPVFSAHSLPPSSLTFSTHFLPPSSLSGLGQDGWCLLGLSQISRPSSWAVEPETQWRLIFHPARFLPSEWGG